MRRCGLMTCMKCGREIPAGQVFCDGCLDVMKKYPVRPDATVHLRRRAEQAAPKKQNIRRRQLSPEEQLPLVKRSNRRLSWCVVLLSLLLTAVCVAVVLQLWEMDTAPLTPPNYNHSTSDTTGNP